MKWKELMISQRIKRLQWYLPLLIAIFVLFYQGYFVNYVHILWGHQGHLIAEIILYGIVGPLVTFLVLAWIRRWSREKELAEKKVREQEQRLALLRIEEGRRVAQHLHREVLPNLAYAANKIDHTRNKRLAQAPSPEIANDELMNVASTLRETIGEMRDKINSLRKGVPLQGLKEGSNFFEEIQRRAKEFGKLFQIKIDLSSSGPCRSLSYELESCLWRIVGEALNNIAIHAQADHVKLFLDFGGPEHIQLSIEDDGKGFDPKEKHKNPKGLGLVHMHEEAHRAGGTLSIESAPNQGTKIMALLPRQQERITA